MSAYDHVHCEYPLPDGEAQDLDYQTKSMPAPFSENYLVKRDGQLLHEEYDEREETDPASPVGFAMVHENQRWVRADFRGQLEIYAAVKQADGSLRWYSYLFWFKDNKVADLQR